MGAARSWQSPNPAVIFPCVGQQPNPSGNSSEITSDLGVRNIYKEYDYLTFTQCYCCWIPTLSNNSHKPQQATKLGPARLKHLALQPFPAPYTTHETLGTEGKTCKPCFLHVSEQISPERTQQHQYLS